MSANSEDSSKFLPYGTEDLDPQITKDPQTGKLRCFVRGCDTWLDPPTRKKNTGEFCRQHGIYCHASGTYRYLDVGRNLVADPEFYKKHLHRHPAKFESHRLGQEKSEDALTWNVFRSFQKAGCLAEVAELVTGEKDPREPKLFLWGIELNADWIMPGWSLLLEAREHFEAELVRGHPILLANGGHMSMHPMKRPPTEPDIAVWLPDEYLVLIEAKFTSPNKFLRPEERVKPDYLTFDEHLDHYWDGKLCILDRDKARQRGQLYTQLWRNLVFAEWMAQHDNPTTRAYHVNLVREGFEQEAHDEFVQLLRPAFTDRFRQATWEQLYAVADRHRPELDRLCRYLETKTANLRKALQIPGPAPSAPKVP